MYTSALTVRSPSIGTTGPNQAIYYMGTWTFGFGGLTRMQRLCIPDVCVETSGVRILGFRAYPNP